ncbi:MAG TPA: ATP-binding protein [Caldisericia bacterium]|nr:ATP-binding protein [Caldisericia bacterium]
MLLQFNFKNFRSFRDDATLDLTATKITELHEKVVLLGNEKILPMATIFGANASGKSNIILAFKYMTVYVLKSFGYGGETQNKSQSKDFSAPTPFLFDIKSCEKESEFEVYFVSTDEEKNKTINYGFSVNKHGIVEEWLNTRAKSSRGDYRRIFYRNTKNGELDLQGIPKRDQENLKIALEPESLIVSLGAKLRIKALKAVRDWFSHNAIVDSSNEIENIFRSSFLSPDFVENEEMRKEVVQYLATFDNAIIDFQVERVEKLQTEQDNKRIKIDSVHRMIHSEETKAIPFHEESAGTRKMFVLHPVLKGIFAQGGILFIDELNVHLHPLLVRNILTTFMNPEININHAQIVFTTHDVWILLSGILRRDEIWFTEKDNDGISSLYSLADFKEEGGVKIRKDADYMKNYLLGRYGAIPVVRSIFAMKDQ